MLESLLTNMLFCCSLLLAAGWVRESFGSRGRRGIGRHRPIRLAYSTCHPPTPSRDESNPWDEIAS